VVSLGGFQLLERLETYYSLRDVYLMLEVSSVDAHNRKIINQKRDKD